MRFVMREERQGDLLEVVSALRPASRFPGRLHGRQQQRDQDPDDGDYDQQLDQGKSRPVLFGHSGPP